jgi:hypothetical protein
MEHPAAAVVVGLGSPGTGLGEILDQVEEGRCALDEVADFRGPVVSSAGDDVDGVLASPTEGRISSFQIPCRFAG